MFSTTRVSKSFKIGLLALFAAVSVSACSVHGVDDYQRAMHMGCKPTASGGVVCGGA